MTKDAPPYTVADGVLAKPSKAAAWCGYHPAIAAAKLVRLAEGTDRAQPARHRAGKDGPDPR